MHTGTGIIDSEEGDKHTFDSHSPDCSSSNYKIMHINYFVKNEHPECVSGGCLEVVVHVC